MIPWGRRTMGRGLYRGRARPTEAGAGPRHRFVGAFRGAVPTDLRNAGRLDVLRTSLGVAWTYGERFGGTPDGARAAAEILAKVMWNTSQIERSDGGSSASSSSTSTSTGI